MPHIPGLLRLPSGRYRLNIRVPKELRGQFGKAVIIRKSLGTADWKEAVSRLRHESHKIESEFEKKRRQLKVRAENTDRLRRLEKLSETETHDLVFRWFIEMESHHQVWWDSKGRKLDKEDLGNPLDDLRIMEAAYLGGTRSIQPADCDDALALLLKEQNIQFEKGPAFNRLSALLQRATLECVRRSLDRVEGKSVQVHENLFDKVFAHTPPPIIERSKTLDELIVRHEEQLAAAKRAAGTRQTYAIPYRLLRETFGSDSPLENIKKDAIEKLFRLLPRNRCRNVSRGGTLQIDNSKQAVARFRYQGILHRSLHVAQWLTDF